MVKRLTTILAAAASLLYNLAESHLHSHVSSCNYGSGYVVGGRRCGGAWQKAIMPCAFSSSAHLHQPTHVSTRQGSSVSMLSPFVGPMISHRSNNSCNLSMSAPSTDDTSTSGKQEDKGAPMATQTKSPEYPLVILIGGSGFLGSEIRQQLQKRGVKYLATSTPATAAASASKKNKAGEDEEEFVPLDLTAADAEEQFYKLIQFSIGDSDGAKKVAVISAMGAIGTSKDESVNSALVRAIKAASRVNDNSFEGDEKTVDRFVMIGNTERVRRLARNVPFLQGYASGKDEAESCLRECFGNHGCIIKPSFIYGGDEISLQPPRLPKNLGGLASEILGLYPIQALADGLPDALALPLAAPVNVEMVASAAINVALGIVEGYTEELEGEAINMAGSVRSWREKKRYDSWLREELEKDGVVYDGSSKDSCSIDAMMEVDEERRWERINLLKGKLLRGGPPGKNEDGIDEDIALMEELECLRPLSMKPAYDPKLNGRWNFVLSKDDLGTQLIKELLPPEYYSFGDASSNDDALSKSEPSSILKGLLDNLYQLKGLYMRIYDEQSQVDIVLASNVCFGRIPIDIVFSTSLLSTNYDEETEGTLFLEKFESIKVGGISLPLPSSWQRFRYLEITFLDEEIVIARGSGGEPHVLVRATSE